MTAADLQVLVGDMLPDRFDAAMWRTVLTITDARPGRVRVLYADGFCPVEDVAYLVRFLDDDEIAA
jgi:hypothetical protein